MSFESVHGEYAFRAMHADLSERDDRIAEISQLRRERRMSGIDRALHEAWVAAEKWQGRTGCTDVGRLHHEAGLLRTLVRELADERDSLLNKRVPGVADMLQVDLGGLSVHIEYGYENDDPELGDSVELGQCWIGGDSVALTTFNAELVSLWEQQALDQARARAKRDADQARGVAALEAWLDGRAA